jgi:hypothetical protein
MNDKFALYKGIWEGTALVFHSHGLQLKEEVEEVFSRKRLRAFEKRIR